MSGEAMIVYGAAGMWLTTEPVADSLLELVHRFSLPALTFDSSLANSSSFILISASLIFFRRDPSL